jgi:hypothetical protein
MKWLMRGASAVKEEQQQQQQQQQQDPQQQSYRLFAVEFTSRKSVEIPAQVRDTCVG